MYLLCQCINNNAYPKIFEIRSGKPGKNKLFDFDNMVNNLQIIIRSWYFHGCRRSTDSDFSVDRAPSKPQHQWQRPRPVEQSIVSSAVPLEAARRKLDFHQSTHLQFTADRVVFACNTSGPSCQRPYCPPLDVLSTAGHIKGRNSDG